MENNNAKQQKDVKLWLLVLLSSAVLIGIGLIVAALGGNSIGDMFGFSACLLYTSLVSSLVNLFYVMRAFALTYFNLERNA